MTVISLPGVVTGKPVDEQPCPEIVALLEMLLEEARRGELRAIAVALVNSGDFTQFHWDAGCPAKWHLLTAAVADLSHEVGAARAALRRGRENEAG